MQKENYNNTLVNTLHATSPRYATSIFIIILLGFYCFIGQGLRGVYDRDEGRYSCVANNMVDSGDWVTPILNTETLHWTKPPMQYWTVAVSVKIFGKNEFAIRFPESLSFFLVILLIYGMSKLLLDERAWVAPLIYATFIFPFSASNVLTTDNVLTLFETAAVFAFVKAVWGNKKYSFWMLTMWFFFGLAFMTKGPVGLLPLITIVIYRYWTRSSKHRGKLLWFPGIIIFLMVVMPWFIMVTHKHPGLLTYFINDEVVGRVKGIHHRNAQWYGAFSVYIPVLLLGTLPWTYWLVRGGYHAIRNFMREKRQWLTSLNEKTKFLLLWVICPLVIFFVAKSRLPLYILPLFVPLSLMLGMQLCKNSSLWTVPRLRLLGGWMILLLLSRIITAYIPSHSDARPLANEIQRLDTKPYDEIYFYNINPRYGLGFYLNTEIEGGDAAGVIDEVNEKENILWISKTSQRDELIKVLQQHFRKQLKTVGTVGKKYTVLQE